MFTKREYITTAYRLGIAPNRITSTRIVECFPPKEKLPNAASLSNLEQNGHGGRLSQKALSKMANSIDWLLAAATEKEVFKKSTGKVFKFRINFITLTLPDTKQEVCDIFFKDKLVKPYLNALRKYYGLNNYVWKLEFQKNGKLHLHITTDTFIHHETIRKQWNRVLKINGLMEDFKTKFGHENPNSTDIHSVQSIKNLAAYLMKYMSKQDEQLAKVKGRIWGCSQALSKANATRVVITPEAAAEYYETLNRPEIEAYDVEAENPTTGKKYLIAQIFKTSHDWLRNRAHPAIRELAHNTLLSIRGLIQIPQLYYV